MLLGLAVIMVVVGRVSGQQPALRSVLQAAAAAATCCMRLQGFHCTMGIHFLLLQVARSEQTAAEVPLRTNLIGEA